ncbi:MAG: hypothetical protein RLZZ565_700, partial [Planctomycetota bacterium]
MDEGGSPSPTAEPPSAPAVEAIVCVGPGPVGVAMAAILGLRGFTQVARIVALAAPEVVTPLQSVLAGVRDVTVRDERDVRGAPDRASLE